MADQASGLRQMTGATAVKVIAVTSGKGGVGKTTVSANLSIALAKQGQRVMLLDADLGLANLDVVLGLHPQYNLSDVLEGRCALEDIILDGPSGVCVVPAASGNKRMAELSPQENAGLIHAFSELTRSIDVLIIDTAAGLSDSVASFTQAAQQVVVTLCDEPASITDAYALIKVLSRDYRVERFKVLTNMTRNDDHGKALFAKIAKVSDRFLNVTLEHIANVPNDTYVRKAIQRQSPVVEVFPSSRAAAAFQKLATHIQRWVTPSESKGQLEFFAERLIASQSITTAPGHPALPPDPVSGAVPGPVNTLNTA